MKITKEVKTAVLVVSAIILLIFGYNFLKGKNLLSNDKVFYANYSNVEGLDISSKVTVNGFVVGKVLDINFAETGDGLKVTFNIEKDFEFGKNSIVKTYSESFIGGKNLAIVPELNPKIMAESGDFITSAIEPGLVGDVVSKLDPIQDKLKIVLDETSKTLTGFNKILSEENTVNISKALKSLTNTLGTLEYTAKNVDALVGANQSKLNATIDNFASSSENINKLSEDLAKAKVSEMVASLDKTIKDFSKLSNKLNTNTGTAGKLINDPTVYDNMDRATRQLDLLLQDMKLNPKRYVHFSLFGKKTGKYEKPNDSLK